MPDLAAKYLKRQRKGRSDDLEKKLYDAIGYQKEFQSLVEQAQLGYQHSHKTASISFNAIYLFKNECQL